MVPLRLAITAGEPAGIGPDLIVMIAQQAWAHELVAICDPALLTARAQQLNLPLTLIPCDFSKPPQPSNPQTIYIHPVSLKMPCEVGLLNKNNSLYVLETLRVATKFCQTKKCAAMITAPVHKGIINDAGIPFSGHTEFLAALTDTPHVVMLLAADTLRVALATTHVPLRDVANHITSESLQSTLRIIHHDLKHHFGIINPHIYVCGLNPHAGEGGHLGKEEIDVIIPALNTLKAQGIQITGPLPADTIFTPPFLAKADVILAMYHDQGLPVLKHVGFGHAVNITLGLPIIRTSVDHGTALDLAGTGHADAGSFIAAINMAATMAEKSVQ